MDPQTMNHEDQPRVIKHIRAQEGRCQVPLRAGLACTQDLTEPVPPVPTARIVKLAIPVLSERQSHA